jgi:hypothetical protein
VLVFVVVGAGLAASELTRSDSAVDRVRSQLDKPPEFGKKLVKAQEAPEAPEEQPPPAIDPKYLTARSVTFSAPDGPPR